jgi:hypothetical protein
MIANELQLSAAKQQMTGVRTAIETFDFQQALKRTGSEVLAQAEYERMASEAVRLAKEMREYMATHGHSTQTSCVPQRRRKPYRAGRR